MLTDRDIPSVLPYLHRKTNTHIHPHINRYTDLSSLEEFDSLFQMF